MNQIEGYMDGLDPNSPEPSENRSHTYRHGFRMGRNDLAKSPGRGANAHRDEAAEATAADRLLVDTVKDLQFKLDQERALTNILSQRKPN